MLRSLEERYATTYAVISTNPATTIAMDRCDCRWPWGLVVLGLVYLGCFRWSFLIPSEIKKADRCRSQT
jgi:hypothetical protein